MGAGHNHAGHDHAGHDHGNGANFGRAFAIGIILNLTFVVVETIYGFAANSMALLADAGHNLSDVLGLVVAYVGALLVKRRPSPRFSYGLKKSSILAALINALLLLVAVGGIIAEAIRRLTSFPATNLGIKDRGLLKPGMMADVAMFDAATIADKATFDKPQQFAVGMRHVLVNGVPVLLDGAMTPARPGRAVRGPGTNRCPPR